MRRTMLSSSKSIDGARNLFVGRLRDYLSAEIDEWELGSICFDLLTDKSIELKKDETLWKHIFNCVDIVWLSDSKDFEEFKAELSKYLEEIDNISRLKPRE